MMLSPNESSPRLHQMIRFLQFLYLNAWLQMLGLTIADTEFTILHA